MLRIAVIGAVSAASLMFALCAEPRAAAITNASIARPVEIPGIHNAFKVSDNVFSGSQPESDASFAALANLGVKTILSVDGAKPDVATARKHGLRYIHLPFGYDGIPTNRVVELAKAAQSLPGPIFVHCHHGRHRGPSAVAIICEANEGWSPNRAEAWMREAGTADDYPGLYRSAAAFAKPTTAQLDTIRELPEVARTSSLVEAMVTIDEHFCRLRQSQSAAWKTPPGQADISPPHEATILWEHLRELARAPDTIQRPTEYRARLDQAIAAGGSLVSSLRHPPNTAAADQALMQISQNCSACHNRYRNK
jgi:protein tyrosine phosphatase (PTP) superfamily phosphohydrolase (DUF442 family)